MEDIAEWRQNKKGCDKKQIENYRNHSQKIISVLAEHNGKASVGTLAEETGLSRVTIRNSIKETRKQRNNGNYLKYPATKKNKGFGRVAVTLEIPSSLVTEKDRLEKDRESDRNLKNFGVQNMERVKVADKVEVKVRRWKKDPNGPEIAQDGSRGYYADE